MRSCRFLFSFLILYAFSQVSAQDQTYAKTLIDSLASPNLHGRGYVHTGDSLAAAFVRSEFIRLGLLPVFNKGTDYFQPFSHAVNTFPGEVSLKIGRSKFVPGNDFIVLPFSGSLSKKGKFVLLEKVNKNNALQLLNDAGLASGRVLVIDCESAEDYKAALSALPLCLSRADAILLLNPGKLTWSVDSRMIEGKAVFEARRELIFPMLKSKTRLGLHVENRFISSYRSCNVAGLIPGVISDTFLLITAHFDHLGRMGSAVFPGANDNASGTAMMMDLARHYGIAEKPKYSLIFIGFAAEEAGLKGSRFFVDNPPVPLNQIRFVFNIDLMGGGEIGSTVVNGTEFPREFDRLLDINSQKGLFGRINKRGKAANSDHYWFSENGVPAFFMYAEGGVTAYHDVHDTRENLPLTKYKELFTLIRLFLDGF
jgi:aminopeptidase YwaD